jgi:predicted MFS family arabinose efflux permease
VGATHWQFVFYLYGLGLPLAFLVTLILKEKQPKRTKASKTEPSQKLSQVLGNPRALWLLLTLGLASISMYAVVIYAPLYLKATIGAGAVLNGIVLASRAVGAAGVSAFGARRLSKTLGMFGATAVGFGLMGLTLGMIPLLHQLNWILLTAVLFGVGFGIVLPNLYSALANLAPSNLRSSVLAAGTGAGFLGQFLSPILLGPVLGNSGLEGVFYTAASVSFVAGGLLLLLNRSRGFFKPNPPEA